MVKEYILVNGKRERAHDVERGNPLFLSEAEWCDRSRKYQDWACKCTVTVFLLSGIGVLFIMYIVIVPMLGSSYIPMIVGIIIVIVASLTLPIIFWATVSTRTYSKRLRDGYPVPGLYEEGLEFPGLKPNRSLFVPYSEIAAIRTGRIYFWLCHDLTGKGGTDIGQFPPWYLGEEGFQKVQERMDGK